MRSYIAMSRVERASDLLIAQPFNPLLFKMGPQSWPTCLLQVLQGEIPDERFKSKCLEAAAASKLEKMLKNETWICRKCPSHVGVQTWKAYFVGGTQDEKDPLWQEKYSK